jgi:capsular exopolysaccharide synthesis family protein
LQATQRASTWLTQEVKTLKAEVQRAELALQEFIESRELIPFYPNGEPPNLALREFHDLATAYTALKNQRVDLEIQLEEVEQLVQRPVDQIPPLVIILDNELIRTLSKQHIELEIQLAELSGQFKSNHPKIISTRNQIDIVTENIRVGLNKYLENLMFQYNILLNKIENYKKIIYEKKLEIIKSNKDDNMYRSLQQDVDSKQKMYESLVGRLSETKIAENLQENNAMIIQKAMVPIDPISMNKIQKLIISIFIMLSFIAGSVIIVDVLDTRFKDIDDIEEYFHIPSLSLIPSHSSSIQHGLVTLEQPHSALSDSYRLLRTNIQIYSMEQRLMSLLITSAVAGEGKTTTTANLGVSFAQLGMKVLLVDADLRRPSLHKIFNISNDIGLSNILTNNDSLNNILQNTDIKNLKVLTSGPLTSNPAELLTTHYIKNFCKNIEDRFDIVIFDSAIILSVPDTLVLASTVDRVCLVYNPDRGDKEKVVKAKTLLERSGANILGITLNNINTKNPLYKYDEYYYNDNYDRDTDGNIENSEPKISTEILKNLILNIWKHINHNKKV